MRQHQRWSLHLLYYIGQWCKFYPSRLPQQRLMRQAGLQPRSTNCAMALGWSRPEKIPRANETEQLF